MFSFRSILIILIAIFAVSLGAACSSHASAKTEDFAADEKPSAAAPGTSSAAAKNRDALIPIDVDGPADTVRAFYQHLRDKKFREAIYLTNLRPALEGLTDMEMKDFQLDFEAIAGDVPTALQINGEIVSGSLATVTLNLPDSDSGEKKVQQIKLRRENNVWVILTVDDATEKAIKQDGKNYLYNLRISTHEDEARKMLDRIVKAQIAFSMQNGGEYGDIDSLISNGFLPDDIKTPDSTGYSYAINITDGKKKYTASATPAVYGKSGRQSYLLTLDSKNIAHLTAKDNGGKSISK